jgi:hypothetical protein
VTVPAKAADRELAPIERFSDRIDLLEGKPA